MLTNINILVGREPPVKTGNTEADLTGLLDYINRLQRALEITLDQIDKELERRNKDGKTA